MTGDRRFVTETLSLRTKADWGAWTADASAQMSYELRLGAFYARPTVEAAYTRLSEGGYQESGAGTGFDLTVARRTGDLLTGRR